MRALLSDFAHALAFLSRLPVPRSLFAGRDLDFSRCVWAFPLAGAVATLPAVALALFLVNAGPFLVAIAAVIVTIVATGALHEDGFADVADGFWGGHNAPRRLTIMRDSQVGTYGALALASLILVRVGLLGHILSAAGVVEGLALWMTAAAISRASLATHWVLLPSARGNDGLSERFGTPTRESALQAIAIALALGFALVAVPGGWLGLGILAAGVAAAALATWGFAAVAHAKIGGRTGDTLGAATVTVTSW